MLQGITLCQAKIAPVISLTLPFFKVTRKPDFPVRLDSVMSFSQETRFHDLFQFHYKCDECLKTFGVFKGFDFNI